MCAAPRQTQVLRLQFAFALAQRGVRFFHLLFKIRLS